MRVRRRRASRWYDQYVHTQTRYAAGEIESETWWRLRVEATWGLISRGDEAVPFAMTMLKSSDADAREDGAAILGSVGDSDEVVDAVLDSLRRESDEQPRDALLGALGHMRNRRAVPGLAVVIRDPEADADTRWTAVEALGRIVKRRFLRQPDPVESALQWLDENGV